jgi:hypothetical protein
MKRQILTGLASLLMASVALGRTAPSYLNDRPMIAPSSEFPAPPQIDATNFINTSGFIDNTFNSLFVTPYATANTVNYTNFGVLGALEGFRFDTFNTHTARYTNAGNVYNGVGAIINCGGTNDGPYFRTNTLSYFFSINGSLCLMSATNIINRGTIELGPDGLLSLQGQNVALSGGLLNMEGFETGDIFGTAGMFDGAWGIGQTPTYNPVSSFGSSFAFSPLYWVTNRYYSALETELALPQARAFVNPLSSLGPSNNLIQVVYLQNLDPSMSNNVYFPGESAVEWVWRSTNVITGLTKTNHLYLFDNMMGITNLVLTTNGIAPPNTAYSPTFIPTNYTLFKGGPFFLGSPASPGLPFGLIGPSTNFTTAYSAYEALFEPTTVIVSDVAGQTYGNAPGRIEVTADKQLDLSSSRIAGLNYVRLTATNNFTQDRNTRILTAVADYNLGVTNATMTVSNLLAPTCPRIQGYVDLFSTSWTNVDATGVTNMYFITMVDSHLASTSPSLVQNLTLHATNIVISDVLNVFSNIVIDAYNVTITTNGPGAQTTSGQLILPPGMPLNASTFPRLLTFTNYGIVSVDNSATFGAPTHPLWDFVNRGNVLSQGCSVWATNLENTGLIDAGPGPINLTATSAVLSNGVLNAPFNDIVITSGSLVISNQVLNAGHNLTLQVTNSLSDGGPASGNLWTSGVLGFSLPIKPVIGDLLGTTISDTVPAYSLGVSCQWAGQDVGPVNAGYTNNAALGKLILDGGTPVSSFVFMAPTGDNALYVDYLEFRDNMANFDDSGNLANLSFGPGMKIYYAQLIINGISWAEKLNGKNGGGLNWVPSYAGTFSSTNMVYPDGTTNRLNLALVTSCDLDSNNNGIVNCLDPAPVLIPSQAQLAVAVSSRTNIVLSWNGVPFKRNYLEVKQLRTGATWTPLTNIFVPGPGCPLLQVTDRFTNTVPQRFYRVRVDAVTP